MTAPFSYSLFYPHLSRLYQFPVPNELGCPLPSFCVASSGGGYLVDLVDGDMPFFRVSFSPIFFRAGYQSKDVFLELVVKKALFL